MKRNILLLFGLIGLLALEYGCDDKPTACSSNTFDITGIDSIQGFSMDSNRYLTTLIADSIGSDKLVFKVNFSAELISILGSSSFAAYATPPCPPPNSNWFIEMITVSEVSGLYDTDWEITDRFYESFQDIDSIRGNEFWNVPIDMYLRPKSAPAQSGMYAFKIRIETTEGNIFETTTDPIIITP